MSNDGARARNEQAAEFGASRQISPTSVAADGSNSIAVTADIHDRGAVGDGSTLAVGAALAIG
jgi:hypothetical protein